MHSTRNSTLDGLGRLGAETDLRTDIKVWMEGEGGGGGNLPSGNGKELRSYLTVLTSQDAKWRGWWARHADPWHPAVQCKGRERPFWRPSSPTNQSRPLANHTTSSPHHVRDVWCVCSVLPTLRSCIPPPPNSPSVPLRLPHPISLYRAAAVTGQSQHEQVPCPACLAQLSHVSS